MAGSHSKNGLNIFSLKLLTTSAGISPSDMYSDPSPSSTGSDSRTAAGRPVPKVGGADWVELCNEWVDPWPDCLAPVF